MSTKLCWEPAVPIIEPQIKDTGLHVWPFNPSFPVDVRFFLLNRQHDIPLHHPDHLELIYIESGEVVYQSWDREYLLQKGDMVVVGDRAYHRCRTGGDSRPQRSAVVLFLPELIRAGDSSDESTNYLLPFTLEESVFPHVIKGTTEISGQIFDLIHRIYAELPRTSEWSRLAVKTYLKMILVLLVDHFLNQRSTQQTSLASQRLGGRFRPVFELVEDRYGEPLSVEEAASIAGYSRWHFMRLFKQVMGQSFTNYLLQFRISKAKELLLSTEKSIVDVGLETGFCDQSYFGMVFRKFALTTPLTYRHRFGEGGRDTAWSRYIKSPHIHPGP